MDSSQIPWADLMARMTSLILAKLTVLAGRKTKESGGRSGRTHAERTRVCVRPNGTVPGDPHFGHVVACGSFGKAAADSRTTHGLGLCSFFAEHRLCNYHHPSHGG